MSDVRDRPPVQLALQVTHADGSKTRWGGDEPDAKNIPQGIEFTTRMPGGFGELHFDLLRSLDIDPSDFEALDDIVLYGAGRDTAFQGHVSAAPRDSAERKVSPAIVGDAARLGYDASAKEIYVDIDRSHWSGPSVQRQINAVTAATDIESGSSEWDVTTGQPAVKTGFTGPWSRAHITEGWYDGHGIPIGSLYYAWKRNPNVGSADTNGQWHVLLSTDDIDSATDDSGNLRAAGPGTGTVTATTATKKFANVYYYYGVAAGSAGVENSIYWTKLAVYGRHGLTKRGTASATDAQGFYGHDIQADIISRWAEDLNFTTGVDGSIEDDTSFIVPHFVLGWDEAATAEEGTLALNQFFVKDWGVFEDLEFFWRTIDADSPRAVIWNARLDEGAKLKLEGDTSESLINGVIAYYTDPNGKSRSVGPTGSLAEVTSASLIDTSADNPVNAHGIARKWMKINIDGVTTSVGATQVAARYLAMKQLEARQGSLEIWRDVEDSHGRRCPAWKVRAGDWVRIADGADALLRRIIQTTYKHDSLTVTCDLDSLPNRLDALMARMGVTALGWA